MRPGKKEIIQAMSNIQSQSTSNPTSISQKAAIAALTGPQDSVGMMVKSSRSGGTSSSTVSTV